MAGEILSLKFLDQTFNYKIETLKEFDYVEKKN